MKFDKIFQAELGRLEGNILLSDLHKFLPMALHHELRVKTRDQWKDRIHVFDSIIKSSEGTIVLDVLVLLRCWVALLGLHILDQLHEIVSVNLVPESACPVLELVLNQSNEIPHVFEANKFMSAILKLLVR
jgi:hypothetical protein